MHKNSAPVPTVEIAPTTALNLFTGKSNSHKLASPVKVIANIATVES